MTARARILDAARDLIATTGRLPSLDAIAAAAGVSKGGLMHHVPNRAALVTALIEAAIDETGTAMSAAAERGDVVDTWVRLSSETRVGETAIADLARVALDARDDLGPALPLIAAAAQRWEELLAAELGSVALARVVRLVGDGLLMSALLGEEPPADVRTIRSALGLR